MIGRTTSKVMQNDFLSSLHRRSEDLQKTQKKLNTGLKILLPSDDPANTVNYMEWKGRTANIEKYNEILTTYQDKLNIVDSQLDAVGTSLHRARELVVQGANGTYTQEDRVAMAIEMDQIIRQVASDANAQYKGKALFSGTSNRDTSYKVSENFSDFTNGPLVSKVDYLGNSQQKVMDVGREDRIISVMSGNSIFQTEKTILQGNKDVTPYVATQNSEFLIDGTTISVSQGDTIEIIAEKINSTDTSVRASVETDIDGASFFRITSLSAREPWLQDINGTSVLEDLGIIDPGTEGGQNYSSTAIRDKSSIFDTLIQVRDDLLANKILEIGGEDLGLIDQSISSVLRYRAYTGAVGERLETNYTRNTAEEMYLRDAISKTIDTDYAKTVSELKMAEFAHNVALSVGAKIIPPTLMDFLR